MSHALIFLLVKPFIQPSKPTEVEQAVPLIYSSGPDAFDYVFKNSRVNATDFLKYAFVWRGGEFSYENHYSLYFDDQMVGIGGVYDARQASKFVISEARNIMGFYKLRCPAVIKHGLQVERIIKLPVKKEITIGHLGITPSHRGKGLGTQLVHALMDRAEQTAGAQFVLDVSEVNPRAKALYDLLGFVVTAEMNSTLKNKYSYVPNHYRMALDAE